MYHSSLRRRWCGVSIFWWISETVYLEEHLADGFRYSRVFVLVSYSTDLDNCGISAKSRSTNNPIFMEHIFYFFRRFNSHHWRSSAPLFIIYRRTDFLMIPKQTFSLYQRVIRWRSHCKKEKYGSTLVLPTWRK